MQKVDQKRDPDPTEKYPLALFVIGEELARNEFEDKLPDMGVECQVVANAEEALAVLNREGYRFGQLVLDASQIYTDQFSEWLLSSRDRFHWLLIHAYLADQAAVKRSEKSAGGGLDTIQDLLASHSELEVPIEYLKDTAEILEFIPYIVERVPYGRESERRRPFKAGDTRFLKEAGPLLFSISRTEEPWNLECEAFTLPASSKGNIGHIGNEWFDSFPSEGSVIRKEMEEAFSDSSLTPEHPIVLRSAHSGNIHSSPMRVILATSNTPQRASTVSQAVDSCIAVIQKATTIDNCATLVLPIIGGGSAGLDLVTIIYAVLEEFDPNMALGDLKHVILTVYEEKDFNEIIDKPVMEIVRSQRLENDLPEGEDRLNVQGEVRALADAMALKDLTPPLVLGIFGGWGSGKSFVLHLLMERLRQIRCWDLRDKDLKERFPYIGHPYVVRFDAWTYAKSELWASLMQKILSDLDKQLNLERTLAKADKELLLRGVDIWSLLGELTGEQIDHLREELGREVLKAFEGWQGGKGESEALWEALKFRRNEERTRLEGSQDNLAKAKKDLDQRLQAKEREIKDWEATQKTALKQSLADMKATHVAAMSAAQAKIETSTKSIHARVDAAMATKEKNAAWGPARDRTVAYVGKAFDKVLKDAGYTDESAPQSIWQIGKEIKLFTKLVRGQTPASLVFLGLGLLSSTAIVILPELLGSETYGTFVSIIGLLVGAGASAHKALTKVNKYLEEEQGKYDMAIAREREASQAKRDELVADEMNRVVRPLEDEIATLEQKYSDRQASEVEQTEADYSKTYEDKQREMSELKATEEEKIGELEEEVAVLVRRVGITGRSKTLQDLIQDRIQSKYYDEKLGILHQVQEDLFEVSEALMHHDSAMEEGGADGSLFPRGKPRVILIIDDLDRCPPEQVVEVLEAIQLLVKTDLFVVVLAVDVRYITRALEEKYRHVLERDGKPSGLDYIEKIVQIPYRVPEITPTAMRSFLQHQMTFRATDEEKPPAVEGGPETTESPELGDGNQRPVFVSSLTTEDAVRERPLPTDVQYFDEKELTLLDESCNKVSVNPRTARRLVNVFKLLKIIWFHRGVHNEPSIRVKRTMMLLLALAAQSPVKMREVLQELCRIMRHPDQQKIKIPNDIMTKHFGSSEDLPTGEELEEVGPENMRLVKSFSFVGEAEDGDKQETSAKPKPRGEKAKRASAPKKMRLVRSPSFVGEAEDGDERKTSAKPRSRRKKAKRTNTAK